QRRASANRAGQAPARSQRVQAPTGCAHLATPPASLRYRPANANRRPLRGIMISAAGADLAVVIGRFQPFHRGHAALLGHALEVAPSVLVVIGSAGAPRLVKNP